MKYSNKVPLLYLTLLEISKLFIYFISFHGDIFLLYPWFKVFKGPLTMPLGLESLCVMFCFISFNSQTLILILFEILFKLPDTSTEY